MKDNFTNNYSETVIDLNNDTNKITKKRISKKRLPKGAREIIILMSFVAVVFIAVAVNFKSFIDVESQDFIYNSYNSRFGTYSDKVVRGDIKTYDGTVVATTVTEGDKESRNYPYKEMFSHVVGYVSKGMAGLEKEKTFELLQTHVSYKQLYENEIDGKKSQGDDLVTTLDFKTQQVAYDKMGFYKGAVVAIEPTTGRIVAMVSKPDFDPNIIDDYWDFITDDTVDSSILLNRATTGLYPPGSTFKIITTIAYLRAHNNDESDFSFNCNSSLKLSDYTIHCSNNKKHGKQNLEQAFAHSCNSAFASIGTDIDKNKFQSVAEDLLLNKPLPTELSNVKASKFNILNEKSEGVIGQSAIGQGQNTVSPLYMAMIVSAIANDGVLMEPYVVDHFESDEGEIVNEATPKKYGDLLSKDEAKLMQKYMKAVTEYGTADDVNFYGLDAYGKTGTAEFANKVKGAHSWYVGYAENERGQKLAVAVIMEGAGYGSEFAAPVAAAVLDAYLN